MLEFLLQQLKTPEMVDKANALPGRPQKMQVSDRHYVLGNKMEGPWPEGHKVFVFANGCFWGSEKGIWRLPGDGIYTTAVGYAAGYTPNPTYEEACSGLSGHTEAVQVVYDPEKISLVDILRWFWEAHDPTQGMGQGNDRGTQYRSGAYYFDDEQALIEASKAAYEGALAAAGIAGPITPRSPPPRTRAALLLRRELPPAVPRQARRGRTARRSRAASRCRRSSRGTRPASSTTRPSCPRPSGRSTARSRTA